MQRAQKKKECTTTAKNPGLPRFTHPNAEPSTAHPEATEATKPPFLGPTHTPRLLVLDDLGPDVMSTEQRNMFLEVVEERYPVWPTIVTSQLPFEQWYDVFGDQTVADAICDRLFHNAGKIHLEGDSMRRMLQRSTP